MEEGCSTQSGVRARRALLLFLPGFFVLVLLTGVVCLATAPVSGGVTESQTAHTGEAGVVAALHLGRYFPVPVVVGVVILVFLSGFFSASETAFLAIPRHRIRTMEADPSLPARLVSRVLSRPGRLLTTILVGNMIVNVSVSELVGTRVFTLLTDQGFNHAAAYALAVSSCAAVLLFFGEIGPKVFAVRARERYARVAVIPLMAADRVLSPIRDGLLSFTDFLFRVTRFHELRAAPFITDEELKSLFSEHEPSGVIEEEERQMIRRILEFQEVVVREILVPRPDVVAVPATTTIDEALALFRQEEFSRMPVYEDDLDHIVGVLNVKDLLRPIFRGDSALPVKEVARPALFVPETMTVQQFVRACQYERTHMAVVVDEYGGTEGVVTLQDAIEEVVGDIADAEEETEARHERLGPDTYRVQGNLALDELEELLDVTLEDEEHETVTGFLMNMTDKVLEAGDRLVYSGLAFTVEAVDGKRAASVRVEVLGQPDANLGEEGTD